MPSKTQAFPYPTEAQARTFVMLKPMVDSALTEMRELSRKKQDAILNPTKVKLLNRLLTDVKEILGTDPSTGYLDLLDEDNLPQNSDAVLILGQFEAAMQQWQAKYYYEDWNTHRSRWMTQENPPPPPSEL